MHRGAIAGGVDGKLAAHAPGNAGAAVGATAVNRYANRQAQTPNRASHEAASRGSDAPGRSAWLGSGFSTADHCRGRGAGRYFFFGSGTDLLGGNLSRQG